MLLVNDLKNLVIQSDYLKKKKKILIPLPVGDDGAKKHYLREFYGLSMHERFDLPCCYNTTYSTTFLGSVSK